MYNTEPENLGAGGGGGFSPKSPPGVYTHAMGSSTSVVRAPAA